ncbi:MAG: alanine--tRNA ligase, partial [Calditrichaeota bacterium]
LIQQAENINGVRVIVHTVKDTDMNALKDLGDALRQKTKQTVGLVAAQNGEKLVFMVFVTDDLLKRYKAGDLIREVAKAAGGGGGGRPHLATAGAKDANRLEDALNRFRELLKA